jgi:hypothetical protein
MFPTSTIGWVVRELNIDFLLGIAQLLKGIDRVKLLKLALRLSEAGSTDSARAIYELCPYLSVDEKRALLAEVTADNSLGALYGLSALTGCYDYLAKDQRTKRMRTYTETLWRQLSASSDATSNCGGFAPYLIQQGLATLVEGEHDDISALADMTQQRELLGLAESQYNGSQIWLARIRLARAWLSYSNALRASTKRLELFEEARREIPAALRLLSKLGDYISIFLGSRLLFLIDYRRYVELGAKDGGTINLLRKMERSAAESIGALRNLIDPARIAGAYTNAGIALRLQAEVEPNPRRRGRLLLAAREIHLRATSIARLVSDDLVPLHLYNAGADLYVMTRTEPDMVKINDMLETISKEMEEVVRLSSTSADPGVHTSALFLRLHCVDELSRMNPVTVTNEVQAELERFGRELEELQSKSTEGRLIAYAYMNLSFHCLRLARAGGTGQTELIQSAEKYALRAYEIAVKTEQYYLVGLVFFHVASILMVKGILNHDVPTLEEANKAIEKSLEVLTEIGDAAPLRSQSLAIEIHVVKYGYTGDKKELTEAESYSRRLVRGFALQKYYQLAAEESYRLATIYLLTKSDKKAEKALNEASTLFRKAGKSDPRSKKIYGNFSATCSATNKLVQSQVAYRKGHVLTAKRLVEEAEREMVRANARWREIWLIRGFKELLSGNLEGAKTNLTRVIKNSRDVVEDYNPTTTGYTAKKLVNFIEEEKDIKGIPPTVIDLPLKSDVVITALKLDRITRELTSVPSYAAYSGQQDLSIEEIRELIKRIMKISAKKGEKRIGT